MALNRREQDKQQARKTSARAWAEQKDVRFEPTAIRLPEGIETWKPSKEGIYKIDVIPYIAGKRNPNADAGMEHFERTYHVHRIPAPNGRSLWYCCTSECFGKPCFVCKWLNTQGGSADPELLAKLRAQKRLLMNVLDVTSKESNSQGIQILDQAFGTEKHPSFGQVLKNKIRSVEEYENFTELVGGYTLYCTIQEDTWPGGKFFKITNVEMVRRKRNYPADMLRKAVCLDNCLIEQLEETMRKAILQETEVEDEEAQEAKTEVDSEDEVQDAEEDTEEGSEEEVEGLDAEDSIEVKRHHRKEPTAKAGKLEEGDWVLYKGETMTIKSISSSGNLLLEDNDEKVYKGVSPTQVKKVKVKDEEDQDENPPKSVHGVKKPTPVARKTADDEDVDETEEEEEEEEDEESEMEEDDWDEEEEEEEEEEEPVTKKRKGQSRA